MNYQDSVIYRLSILSLTSFLVTLGNCCEAYFLQPSLRLEPKSWLRIHCSDESEIPTFANRRRDQRAISPTTDGKRGIAQYALRVEKIELRPTRKLTQEVILQNDEFRDTTKQNMENFGHQRFTKHSRVYSLPRKNTHWLLFPNFSRDSEIVHEAHDILATI